VQWAGRTWGEADAYFSGHVDGCLSSVMKSYCHFTANLILTLTG
jgi:hypothetical protein